MNRTAVVSIGGAIVFAVIGIYVAELVRSERACRLAVRELVLLRAVGPDIMALSREASTPQVWYDQKALSLMAQNSVDTRVVASLAATVVAVPLVEDLPPTPELSVGQVVAFCSSPPRSVKGVTAYITTANGDLAMHVKPMRARSVNGARDATEFFSIAARMWHGAQSGDKSGFSDAAAAFTSTDLFVGSYLDGPVALSGKQLQAMATVLEQHSNLRKGSE